MSFNLYILIHVILTASVAMSSLMTAVSSQIPDLEMNALFELYQSTQGSSWRWKNEFLNGPRWNFTRDGDGFFVDNPCSSGWQGVTCSKRSQSCSVQTCQITQLKLGAYNLTGSIPREIGNLSILKVLDLDMNTLNGSIPKEIGNLVVLEVFDLFSNALTGSIPSEIGNLVVLDNLSIFNNTLTGSIPSEIFNLVVLKSLNLFNNRLSGSIPSGIGNLSLLEVLDLFNNALTGPIPKEIGDLVFLQWLDLFNNALTGSIPNEIGNLVLLKWLGLSNNALTGSIPSQIGNLKALLLLDFFNNTLTGSFPSEIGNLVLLKWLNLYNNALTGSIPSQIGNLSVLMLFDLFNNTLTGSIPSEIGNLVMLEWLYLFDNALTGSIPSEIGNLVTLEVLYLFDNALTGSIPSEIGNLMVLEWLDISNSALTGSIPSQIGNLVVLEVLNLSNNALTGPIPSEMGNLVMLEWLYLFNNALTRSIPREIGNLLVLEWLDLDNNRLSGSIPSEIANIWKLQSLFLQSNSFTGRVDHVFNASAQKALEVIDLSDNLLSGHYLDSIFLLPQIKVLALSVNCFQEKLSAVMCEAATIEVLSLNGLRAAQGCKNVIKFPISDVALFNTIGGTLPECVWRLRNLTTLHLSGNGLTGEIIPQLPKYSQVGDLSLSHNQLGGTIPLHIQQVQKVDLSRNQISGNYDDYPGRLWMNDFLDLEINRLSGRLPVSKLENVSDLNILRGNMFSCESVPDNDEFSTDYICGSEDLNESLYVFISAFSIACCIALVACVALVTARRSVSSIIKFSPFCVHEYMSRFHMFMTCIDQLKSADSSLHTIIVLRDKYKSIYWLSVQLLFVTLVTVVPIYIVRGNGDDDASSTHTNTYSWFWSLAYLRGVVPSSLILMSWVVTVAACFYRIVLFPLMEEPPVESKSLSLSGSRNDSCESRHDTSSAESVKNDTTVGKVKAYYYGWIAGVVLVNMAVTVTVNALYIYSSEQPLSVLIRLCLQMNLAVFRLVYAYCVLPLLTRSIEDTVANIGFRLRLQVLNNLVIPCLVTSFASPSCFQGLIVAADTVSTPYSYDACSLFLIAPTRNICLSWIQVDVESAPFISPFVYNNQCASVLLTSYIPVLILGFSIQIVSCFIIPLILSRLGKWLNLSEIIHHKVLKGILWPEFWVNSDHDSDLASRNQVGLEKDPTIILNSKSTLCFDVLNNLMIMLSFGLCSPVLAIAITCTVMSKMNVLILLIGRFTKMLRGGDDDENVHFALVALARIHFPLAEVLKQSFWVIMWTSALFFSFVCWDIAGDEVGWRESIWIPIVTISYPLLLWVIAIYMKYRVTLLRHDDCDVEEEKMRNTRDTDLELWPLPPLDATSCVEHIIKISDGDSNGDSNNVHLNPMHSSGLQL